MDNNKLDSNLEKWLNHQKKKNDVLKSKENSLLNYENIIDDSFKKIIDRKAERIREMMNRKSQFNSTEEHFMSVYTNKFVR